MAASGKVFQSSTYNELGNPDNAIDGSTSANYLRGHCTHTQLEINPWWAVDLTAEFRVSRVAVTNRGDCCEERLNRAEIRIGNSPEEGGITNPRYVASLQLFKVPYFHDTFHPSLWKWFLMNSKHEPISFQGVPRSAHWGQGRQLFLTAEKCKAST